MSTSGALFGPRPSDAELQSTANQLRLMALEGIFAANSGHPGSSFSCAEIITALFFGGVLRVEAKQPQSDERDIFIMSKGHGCPMLYAALAKRGFFPPEEMLRLRQLDALLEGHPERKTPGIEIASGPLGQGLSVATGAALAFRARGVLAKRRVVCLLGDGECDEGNVWEAAAHLAKERPANLVAVVDRNGLQIDGPTEEILPLGDLGQKFRAFGLPVAQIDGHDFSEIFDALEKGFASGEPLVVVANTTKGKGVSFMENQVGWHGKAPNEEQFLKAKGELQTSS